MSSSPFLVRTVRRGHKVIAGSFTTDGSGNPTIVSGVRRVTVAKNGTGGYRLTLLNPTKSIISAVAIILKSTVSGQIVELAATSATNRRVDLRVVTISSGLAADLVSGAVHFTIHYSNL